MSGGTLILPDGEIGTDLKMGADGPYFGFDDPNAGSAASGLHSPVIANISVAIANQEIEYALPVGTRAFAAKSRSGRSIRLGFASGDTSLEYLSMRGVFWNVNLSASHPLSLFFACGVAGEVVEVVSWL